MNVVPNGDPWEYFEDSTPTLIVLSLAVFVLAFYFPVGLDGGAGGLVVVLGLILLVDWIRLIILRLLRRCRLGWIPLIGAIAMVAALFHETPRDGLARLGVPVPVGEPAGALLQGEL